MKNPIDSVLASVAPGWAASRAKARLQLKALEAQAAGYEAAGNGRRNTWSRGSDKSQNGENRNALTLLRARHRDLVRNNCYANSAINVRTAYTVGEGLLPFAYHPSSKRKQKKANELIRAWARYTSCDVEDMNNLAAMQKLAFRTIGESGESLLMRQMNSNTPRGDIPLQLRLLEGDYLDQTFDQRTDMGVRWVQGVGIDRHTMRRNFFRILDEHPGESGNRTGQNVPGDQIAHGFEMLRPGQVRGLPAGIPAMMRLRNLDDFQDARLETQKIAALLGVIAYSEKGESVLPERLEPGLMAVLQGGSDETIETITPPSVSGQHDFVVEEARMIAKAYGITYEALAGDLTGVNFTSGKMGRTDMMMNVRDWRKHIMVNMLMQKVGKWFLMGAELAGHDLSGVEFFWVAPRIEMIDAAREVPAVIKQVRAGLGSFSTHMRSLGYDDPEAELQRASEDFGLMEDLALRLDCDPRQTTNGGQGQSDNPLNDNPEDSNSKENDDEPD